MIHYYTEDVKFDLKGKRACSAWLKNVVSLEKKVLGDLSIIFCSDEYLLDINKRYLVHDYYTDIITFNYCEGDIISGDLFISIDSVRENAKFYNVKLVTELNRVIVHGVLHLIGYDDHNDEDIKMMRAKENHYLECKAAMM